MKPFINWHMGQRLLPEHLELMQNINLEYSYMLATSLSDVKPYGVVSIDIDKVFLTQNTIKIIEFRYIDPKGIFIDSTTNCTFPNFSLEEIKENNSTVFVNIYKKKSSISYKEISIATETYEGILSNKLDNNAELSLHLFNVEKNIVKNWEIAKNYVPASLNFNIDLFSLIKAKIELIIAQIEYSWENLKREDNFTIKRVDFKNLLVETYVLKNFMLLNKSRALLSPYQIFTQLFKIYVRLLTYYDVKITDEKISVFYEHDDLNACFNKLTQYIEEVMLPNNLKISYHSFYYDGNLFSIKDLPSDLFNAKDVYFVIQKFYNEQEIDIDSIKISTISRIPILDQKAISGLTKVKCDGLMLDHHLNEKCDFFKINIFGKEWDYVCKERNIAFRAEENYKTCSFYIYYK